VPHERVGAYSERVAITAVAPAPLAIQRKCACGGTELAGGECAACRAKRLAAQSSPLLGHDFSRIRVAPAGDIHEQEADRVADEVGRMTDAEVGDARPQLTAHATPSFGGGEPLPLAVRSYFEPHLGRDLGVVRVHTDTQAAQMAGALQAEAFTYGNDIYFNEGRYAPGSTAGRRLLAHELVHTVQQTGAVGRQIQRQPQPPAPAAPLPGAGLVPPGDCSWAEHRLLQDEVDRACDRDTRCTQNDSCATLWEKIGFNAECIRARATINARCFRGGNLGHIIALANAVAALGRCWAVYNRECQQQGPRVPAPAPEPAAEPERRPVVDRTFMERMAAITGLTGTALVIYLIVSEGTRLFPPRNLIPVP
jgi:Domain of unknown function (DUF4157)/Novel toxin 16